MTVTRSISTVSRQGYERVAHRERLGTVNGSVGFSLRHYRVNPGLQSTFPYLAAIASRFQQYRIVNMRFEYVTRTSTASTGSVYLAAEYDNGEGDPDDEAQLSAYHGCINFSPWVVSASHHVDVKAVHALGPRKLIRQGPMGNDYNNYDACKLIIATTGQASAATIGQLFIEYDIEFFVEQVQRALPAPSNIIVQSYDVQVNYVDGVSKTVIFPTVDYYTMNSVTYNNGVFTFPTGAFWINAKVTMFCTDTVPQTCSFLLEAYQNGVTVSEGYDSLSQLSTPGAGTTGTVTGWVKWLARFPAGGGTAEIKAVINGALLAGLGTLQTAIYITAA